MVASGLFIIHGIRFETFTLEDAVTSLCKGQIVPRIWKGFLALFENLENEMFFCNKSGMEKRFLLVHLQTVHLFVCF